MKPFLTIALGIGLACLFGCGTNAPQAPIGLDKRPANTAETIASLIGTGDHTPAPAEPQAVAAQVLKPVPSAPVAKVAAPIVISDFTTPEGIRSLSEPERGQLVDAARSANTANTVVLLVRGERAWPSRASWNCLVRAVEVKRFLVSQGIAPSKVRLFIRSAGAFVADNGTMDGRARNRRVEIHFDQVDHGQKS